MQEFWRALDPDRTGYARADAWMRFGQSLYEKANASKHPMQASLYRSFQWVMRSTQRTLLRPGDDEQTDFVQFWDVLTALYASPYLPLPRPARSFQELMNPEPIKPPPQSQSQSESQPQPPASAPPTTVLALMPPLTPPPVVSSLMDLITERQEAPQRWRANPLQRGCGAPSFSAALAQDIAANLSAWQPLLSMMTPAFSKRSSYYSDDNNFYSYSRQLSSGPWDKVRRRCVSQ